MIPQSQRKVYESVEERLGQAPSLPVPPFAHLWNRCYNISTCRRDASQLNCVIWGHCLTSRVPQRCLTRWGVSGDATKKTIHLFAGKSDVSHANLPLSFPLLRMHPIPHHDRKPRKAEAERAENYRRDSPVTSAATTPKQRLLGTSGGILTFSRALLFTFI